MKKFFICFIFLYIVSWLCLEINCLDYKLDGKECLLINLKHAVMMPICTIEWETELRARSRSDRSELQLYFYFIFGWVVDSELCFLKETDWKICPLFGSQAEFYWLLVAWEFVRAFYKLLLFSFFFKKTITRNYQGHKPRHWQLQRRTLNDGAGQSNYVTISYG